MKNKQIIVRCTYSDTDQMLAELIQESFRFFLQKELFALLFASRCSIVVTMNGRLFREDSLCT